MKMYYIANVSMPTEKAHGIHVAKTAEALIEAGNSVTLIIPNRRKSDRILQEFYGLRVPVETIEVGRFYFRTPSPLRYRLNALLFAYAYVRYLRARKDDSVVYTVDIDKWSCIGLPYIKKPYFSEVHGAKKGNIIQRAVFTDIKGVIATTAITASELIQTFSLHITSVIVEPNGTDPYQSEVLSKAEARTRCGIDVSKPLVLYVGRVIAWKGIDILPHVARLVPGVRIGFLGATREEFERILGISAGDMEFYGSVAHTEVPIWISASDACLVLGSHRDYYSANYTSPMKVFEYMQMERPVIASDTPVFKSLFSTENVVYFEPDNPESLAESIQALLSDTEKMKQLAIAGRVYAEDHSWIKRAERITAFMQERLSAPRKPTQ